MANQISQTRKGVLRAWRLWRSKVTNSISALLWRVQTRPQQRPVFLTGCVWSDYSIVWDGDLERFFLPPLHFLFILSSCLNSPPKLLADAERIALSWYMFHVQSRARQSSPTFLLSVHSGSRVSCAPGLVYMVRNESPPQLSHRWLNQSLSDLPTQQATQERDYQPPEPL